MKFRGKLNAAKLGRSAARGILLHLPALVFVLLFLLTAELLLAEDARRVGYEIDGTIASILKGLAIYAGVLAFLAVGCLAFVKSRYEILLQILDWLRKLDWLEVFLIRIPIAFLIIIISGHLYVNFKVNITEFQPYVWDLFFANFDRFLFFGLDPWKITHFIFPGLSATDLIDNLYLLWFFELKVVTMAAACLPLRNHLRLSYLLAFAASAALSGNLLAILMPAAGPVYMEALTGDATFAPMIERLQEHGKYAEIKALEIQARLWEGYINPAAEPLGISAFPSMHVQYAALCALFVFALNRPLGWALWVYTGVMLIGSVHLGWHYAVDGIVGIGLAIATWKASAWVTGWWLDRIERRDAAEGSEGPMAAE